MARNKVIIDTSVLIEHMRKGGPQKFVELVEEDYEIYISMLTYTELWAGQSMQSSKIALEISQWLQSFHVVQVTEEIAKLAGEIMRKSKHIPDIVDAVIAASAMLCDCSVYTLNRKHFQDIPNLKVV